MEPESTIPMPPHLVERPKTSYWRRAGGGSLAISLIVHGVFLALGLFWVLAIIPPPPEKIVDFKPSGGGGNPSPSPSQKKQAQMVKSHVSRVAAKDVASNFTLPDPVASNTMSKLGTLGSGGMQGLGGSGAGGGQGSGIGTGFGSGMGDGMNKGAAPVFFGLEMRAQRIAYVIDFSITMLDDGKRDLLIDELSKSVKALPDRTKFQLIFFSGPVWTAGDKIVGGNTVVHKGKEYKWTSKSLWEWAPVGPMMKVEWQEATETQKKRALQDIKSATNIGGTDWEGPLKMAMAMEPPPEEIFFMTDGEMEKRDMGRLARGLAAMAKSKNIKIHTVNMMVPKGDAAEAMRDLAVKTGGKFTIVEKGGRVRKEKE